MSPIKLVQAFIALMACFVFAFSAVGQVNDPFGAAPVPGDPFAIGRVPEGDPVIVRFQVVDVSGKPVAGASIQGNGIRSRIVTDGEGKAEWIATDNQLLQLSSGKTQPLRFKVIPARDSIMPRLVRQFEVEKLLDGETLEFQTRPGVELRGRVVGARDARGVQGVMLYFAAQTASNPMRSSFYTLTNERGEWSIVIPRVASQIVATGSVPGYKIGEGLAYSTTVEIPAEVPSVEVPEFVIEQTERKTVFVVVDGNEAVSDAHVEAWYPKWLDENLVMFESMSPSESTDEEGRCFLILKHADRKTAIIKANVERNGVAYSGRTEIPLDKAEHVVVRLFPPASITGKLTRDGKPLPDVGLVLYETLNVPGKSRSWFDTGMRGEAMTDQNGEFEFLAEPHVQYAIALSKRDADGKQRVLHRTPAPVSDGHHVLPQLEFEKTALP